MNAPALPQWFTHWIERPLKLVDLYIERMRERGQTDPQEGIWDWWMMSGRDGALIEMPPQYRFVYKQMVLSRIRKAGLKVIDTGRGFSMTLS